MQPGAQVLARFDDGAPALVERRVGTAGCCCGRSSLDLAWNDLALKPVFLPFMHQLVRYLAAYREPEPWLTVGEVLDPARTLAGASERRAHASSDAVRPAHAARPRGARCWSWPSRASTSCGRRRTRPDRPPSVAANVDLAESDLTPMDPKEVVAAVAGRDAASRGGRRDRRDDRRRAAKRRSGCGGTCCSPAAMLLAAETLVSNRVSKV